LITFKRRVANLIERLSGNLVIPPNQVHLGPERVHLRRFFAHFGIDCVFDVGANRGQYARMLRETVGYRGPIISYEPIPELVNDLKAQAAAASDWYIEALAVDRESGPATFHVMQHSEFSSLHRPAADQPAIFRKDNAVREEVNVMRTTIAEAYAKWQATLGFERPFLKMDTQGNDPNVVAGAGGFLERFVGLQSELAIKKLYADSLGISEALAAYTSRGFELSALVPNNAGHFPLLVEVDCIMFRSNAAAT
jgi:FkbM family methyltransferase